MEEEKNMVAAAPHCPEQTDYLEQAKELADSYRLLVHRRDMLRQQYEDSRSWFYTKDEIIDKLSQGAQEESERVQTSGTSNPVERTVLNCDKVLASMNREVQTQRTEQFLEPYYEVCEQIELFEIGLRSLRGKSVCIHRSAYCTNIMCCICSNVLICSHQKTLQDHCRSGQKQQQ